MTQEEVSSAKNGNGKTAKQGLHLHRRLFLLVFAVALLWQTLLLADTRLSQYYTELADSFKVILTVDGKTDNAMLAQMGETINQKEDVSSVKLFSSQDALAVVERQNPQLAESLLLMGRNKMPAYFELRLTPAAVRNVSSLVANLVAEYKELMPHYNEEHAQLVFITGLCVKLLRTTMLLALLLFLAFMFLVEAYPSKKRVSHFVSGMFSGILAALSAMVLVALLVYPTGFLSQAVQQFVSPALEILLVVFCGLFGWTLSKWQRF